MLITWEGKSMLFSETTKACLLCQGTGQHAHSHGSDTAKCYCANYAACPVCEHERARLVLTPKGALLANDGRPDPESMLSRLEAFLDRNPGHERREAYQKSMLSAYYSGDAIDYVNWNGGSL
jgi:hypothetical protein